MEKFERADPNALADFDPRTKVCTMNCGPTVGDPRSPDERRFLCPDCVTVPATSGNRANDLFAALLEFHNAFCNRDETTSLHVWNERMKAADENAVAVLNAAPHSASQPDTVAVPMDYKELYLDLIMQVGKKWPDESRHDTAKRYIIKAETGIAGVGAAQEAK